MRTKPGKSTGGTFRVANGGVIDNVGEAQLSGKMAGNGAPVKMTAQVAGVTKPLAAKLCSSVLSFAIDAITFCIVISVLFMLFCL